MGRFPINLVPKCYPLKSIGYKLYWVAFGNEGVEEIGAVRFRKHM